MFRECCVTLVVYFFRPWHTLSSSRSLRMPGRCVQRLWLKGFTSEFHTNSTSFISADQTGFDHHIVSVICSFSDDHVKFFCFQVLEHQIKFRWGWRGSVSSSSVSNNCRYLNLCAAVCVADTLVWVQFSSISSERLWWSGSSVRYLYFTWVSI